MPGNPPETKIKILKILCFYIFSEIFGSGGSRQGSTTGNHAWPRGPPAGPRVGTPTTGWPATLPGKPGGSQEAGGSIGAVQGTARAISKIYIFLIGDYETYLGPPSLVDPNMCII